MRALSLAEGSDRQNWAWRRACDRELAAARHPSLLERGRIRPFPSSADDNAPPADGPPLARPGRTPPATGLALSLFSDGRKVVL